MSLIKKNFTDSHNPLVFFIEIEDSNDYWKSRQSWFGTVRQEAEKLGIEFQSKEFPEGIGLRFFKPGDYETLMLAVDTHLQAHAEDYRSRLIGRAEASGIKFPKGFDRDHAIKHGEPPPEGWQPPEPGED